MDFRSFASVAFMPASRIKISQSLLGYLILIAGCGSAYLFLSKPATTFAPTIAPAIAPIIARHDNYQPRSATAPQADFAVIEPKGHPLLLMAAPQQSFIPFDNDDNNVASSLASTTHIPEAAAPSGYASDDSTSAAPHDVPVGYMIPIDQLDRLKTSLIPQSKIGLGKSASSLTPYDVNEATDLNGEANAPSKTDILPSPPMVPVTSTLSATAMQAANTPFRKPTVSPHWPEAGYAPPARPALPTTDLSHTRQPFRAEKDNNTINSAIIVSPASAATPKLRLPSTHIAPLPSSH